MSSSAATGTPAARARRRRSPARAALTSSGAAAATMWLRLLLRMASVMRMNSWRRRRPTGRAGRRSCPHRLVVHPAVDGLLPQDGVPTSARCWPALLPPPSLPRCWSVLARATAAPLLALPPDQRRWRCSAWVAAELGGAPHVHVPLPHDTCAGTSLGACVPRPCSVARRWRSGGPLNACRASRQAATDAAAYMDEDAAVGADAGAGLSTN